MEMLNELKLTLYNDSIIPIINNISESLSKGFHLDSIDLSFRLQIEIPDMDASTKHELTLIASEKIKNVLVLLELIETKKILKSTAIKLFADMFNISIDESSNYF
jgi:hypothetical protein